MYFFLKPLLLYTQHTPVKRTVRIVINKGITKEVDLRNYVGVGQGISKRIADDIRIKIELVLITPFY